MVLRIVLLCIALLCVAVTVSSAASVGASGAGSCPRLSSAEMLPAWPTGGRLFGDVDGDGRGDRASIRFARRAPASCAFFVVVKTRTRTLALRVPEHYKPPSDLRVAEWPFEEPYVALIVRLSAHRSQIVVARWHGASIAVVSLCGTVGGRLMLLRFPPPSPETLDLFGSAGTGTTAARCRRGGPLILTSEGPANRAGTRWRFNQAQYRLTGGRFRVMEARSVVVPASQRARVAARWGAFDSPFEGCVVARGRRL